MNFEPQPNSPQTTKNCPFCSAPIPESAIKCRFCREHLVEKPVKKFENAITKAMTYLGLGTAAISMLFGLREGYFFIEEQQQKRATIESHKSAAAHFERQDNLDYSVQSLEKALTVSPNDQALQLRFFMLKSHSLLRELEDWGPQAINETTRELITTLTLDGFRLLYFSYPDGQRAQLLVMLGRLLAQDYSWRDETEVSRLYEEAHALTPNDVEVILRRGRWLLNDSDTGNQGVELLKQAAQLAPNNSLVWAELGNHYLESGNFVEALNAFRTAVALKPQQNDLQAVRAANMSKGQLRRLLIAADAELDITAPGFLQLSAVQVEQLLEEVLSYTSRDDVRLLASRFYLSVNKYPRAIQLVQEAIGNDDMRTVARYHPEQLDAYAAALRASGLQPEILAEIDNLLTQRDHAKQFEEILETGPEGGHVYKLGLKVPAGKHEDGLPVVEAFSEYPFAKAGVQTGDRIVRFAHRPVTTLRDIWIPLIEFQPGTELPLQILRDGATLDLTIHVE